MAEDIQGFQFEESYIREDIRGEAEEEISGIVRQGVDVDTLRVKAPGHGKGQRHKDDTYGVLDKASCPFRLLPR